MRQDAVMQQVFQHVNHTLEKDDDTRKRALCIRTYKVIPTTPQTGHVLSCILIFLPAVLLISIVICALSWTYIPHLYYMAEIFLIRIVIKFPKITILF